MLIEGVKTEDGSVKALAVDADGKLLVGGITIDGDVTIGSEVEISNDDGNPVPVSGPLTDTQLRATPVPVSGTVTATGPLTDTQLRAADVKVTLDSETVVLGAGSAAVGTVGVTSLPALPAGSNAIGTVGVTSLPATPAGENHIGSIGSNTVKVGVELTRPTGTDAYIAKDVISDSTSTPTVLTFANFARANGGSGVIVRARLMSDKKDLTASFRLHLFHTAPTAINDNAPYLMLYANAANRIGMIDFPAMASEDPTNSTAAGTMRPSSDGAYGPPNLWFQSASDSRAIYGVLETTSAFTPASQQKFYIELAAILD